MFPKAASSNTGIPRVNVAAGASGDEQPEVDVSDDEFLQFDTSKVPVIVTLTKVGKHYIVDATSEEESQTNSAVSISVVPFKLNSIPYIVVEYRINKFYNQHV
ncbi:hypothetical protein FF1_045732 [Malus domestica]|uniref:uncharacterized protein LOC126633767 n=1 Tax=Malus sylvestris TaxID=3752 RepID=UPI0021ABEEBB|nr:uncharacterized protein LOC126633767 [Malus sylvestris]